VKPRERVLAVDELHRVWKAAGAVGGTGGALVQMLMLTGQRRFETSMMRWQDLSDLDGDSPLWSIPAEITKNSRPHTVTLSHEAVELILAQPRIDASELVFTTTGTAPFSGFSKLKKKIDTQIAADGSETLAPWTLHDLCRSLVTGLNEQGIAAPHIIEAIVNHVSRFKGGIAGVYNRATYLDERRRALEAWAIMLTNISNEADVVRFPKRSA
jgi:integrase